MEITSPNINIYLQQKRVEYIIPINDKKFSDKETLSSASVAADRSANERAVRLVKQPGYLQQCEAGSSK